ncbi:MAG: endonuclease III [Candidatus Bathyarchaeota archaeon]|nr:endonuclease III [Candidatus Bathyarchaeota archaeon]
MEPKDRAMEVMKRLEAQYPHVDGTVLNFETPLDLLIATILSAQSTDQQINKVTQKLFKKYRTAADYAYASSDELKNDIRSSGFFNRKADAIQASTKVIAEEYDGVVPDTMEKLIKLKGVARKTANIVLSGAYGKVEGIAVDTHVFRLSKLLGLTQQKTNRDKIEQDLMTLIPRKKWFAANYLLISHGRAICNAKKPDCENCVLSDLCPSAFTFPHNKK